MLTPPLDILNLPIQIELEDAIGCQDLRITAIADRKTDLRKLPGSLSVEGNDEIIDRIGFHVVIPISRNVSIPMINIRKVLS